MSALFLLDRCNASLHLTFLQRGSPIRKCFLKENSPSDCLGGTRYFHSCWLPLSDFSPRQPEPMMILLCAFSLFYGLTLAASAGFFRPQLSRQREEEEGEMEGREKERLEGLRWIRCVRTNSQPRLCAPESNTRFLRYPCLSYYLCLHDC